MVRKSSRQIAREISQAGGIGGSGRESLKKRNIRIAKIRREGVPRIQRFSLIGGKKVSDTLDLSKKPEERPAPQVKELKFRNIQRATTITKTPIREITRLEPKQQDIKVTQLQKQVGKLRLQDIPIKDRPKGFLSPVKREKGLVGLQQKLNKLTDQILFNQDRRSRKTKSIARQIIGQVNDIGLLAGAGAGRGLVGTAQLIKNPVKSGKAIFQALKTPKGTARIIGEDFTRDPIGTIFEFASFNKGLSRVVRVGKDSSIGQAVSRELFIAKQPKPERLFVRAILKGQKAQLGKTPKKLPKPDFAKAQTLNTIEAKALEKTLKGDKNSVVFGSVIGGRKVHDIDFATANIKKVSEKFIKNLPKNQQKNFVLKKEKVFKKGQKDALFDIKSIDRIRPNRRFIQRVLKGKGTLPVGGFAFTFTKGEEISKVKGRRITRTVKTKTGKKKKITEVALKGTSDLPKAKKSKLKFIPSDDFAKELAIPKRRLREDILRIPTEKTTKFDDILFLTFSEQTTRKGLGALQVLLENNVRRAKDPKAFVDSLEIQLKSLKKSKNPLNKLRARSIQKSLTVLKSKKFKDLLLSKVKGNKEATGRLKEFLKADKPLKIDKKPKKQPKTPKKKKAVKLAKKQPKLKPIKLQSIIPKKIKPQAKKISRVPKSKVPKSKIPKKRVPSTRIPRSKQPKSRTPRSKTPSKVPRSKVPTSKVPPTKRPPSRIPPSKPPSRLPPSKPPRGRSSRVPPSKPPKITFKKITTILPPVRKRKPSKVKKKTKKKGKTKQLLEFTRTIDRGKLTKKQKKGKFTGIEFR